MLEELLRIPEPVAQGSPEHGYPFPWGIYKWISGECYRDDLLSPHDGPTVCDDPWCNPDGDGWIRSW